MWIVYAIVTIAIAVMAYKHGKFIGSKEAWIDATNLMGAHRRRS